MFMIGTSLATFYLHQTEWCVDNTVLIRKIVELLIGLIYCKYIQVLDVNKCCIRAGYEY